MSFLVWIAALVAYGLFLAWYENWGGPLKPAEIDRLMSRMEGTPGGAHNDLDIIRRFLEQDDGREFVMVNLVKVNKGDVPHPVSGAPTPGRELMSHYTNNFLPALVKRGGHPAVVARKVGGYVDAWQVGPDPGWTIVGFMRYRSRRDMAELASDPRFTEIHPFKMAATAETFSFPTQTMLLAYVSPRVWVALVLALLASLAQIALLAGA